MTSNNNNKRENNKSKRRKIKISRYTTLFIQPYSEWSEYE